MASWNSCGPCQPLVLVVEDDPAVRRLIETVLLRCGLHVVSATNGRTALEIGQDARLPLDLLIADLGLPGINGCDLAQRLKRARPKLAVLYMSGYLEGDLIECCKLDPSSQFLPKPFSPADLAARAQAALRSAWGLKAETQQCVRFAPSLAMASTVHF